MNVGEEGEEDKILLIGAGSIGKRYKAILDCLRQPYQICEIEDKVWDFEFDKAIIATPTETHFDIALQLARMGKTFLCEKPTSKVLYQAELMAKIPNAYVVNNYACASGITAIQQPIKSLHYNFFNTGKDGLVWDMCQLIYLSYLYKATLYVFSASFHWIFKINGSLVPYWNIEETYFEMIHAFIYGFYDDLWTTEQGFIMTKLCREINDRMRSGDEGFQITYSDSGEISVKTFSRENLPDDRGEDYPQMGL